MASQPKRYSAVLLAEQTQVTVDTTRKLLKLLVQHNVVESVRGAQGGYQLITTPEQLSLLSVVEAIDGQVALTECCHVDTVCGKATFCQPKKHWKRINQVVSESLSKITLAELI